VGQMENALSVKLHMLLLEEIAHLAVFNTVKIAPLMQ